MSEKNRLARAADLATDIRTIGIAFYAFVVTLAGGGYWVGAHGGDFFRGQVHQAVESEFTALNSAVTDLRREVAQVGGSDRVVQVRLNQSYVLEPVGQGDNVQAQYFIRRTELGLACKIVSGVPVFRDVRNVAFPGRIITPLQQFSGEWRRAQATFEPPAGLLPGRIELSVSLEYACRGQTVFDELPALAYTLTG